MSGHSKWSTIKRKKGEIDAQRSRIFQKLAKELYVAARSGDKNPDNNASLRMVVEKARGVNMPKDRIQGAIDKAHGAAADVNYESIRYEGYGPSGIAVMVDCLTDNRNRTASFVRSSFTKKGGNLGTDGSVAYLFTKKGIIIIDKTYDEEKVMECAIGNDALDFVVTDETYEIYTTPQNFISIKEALITLGIEEFIMSEVTFIANSDVKVDEEIERKNLELIELLEDIDDVQNVYHNMELN